MAAEARYRVARQSPNSRRADFRSERFKEFEMQRPAEMDIVRLAYQLWEQAGKPDGRDQEFYRQAERELQEANERAIPEQPR
jgi:Protein of unknown function (DUF2934)